MNILIPDSWLREYLKTDATPTDIKRCLSLCGPSVERINSVGKDIVYDIEVTTNRVDMMSVVGIAREASVILPEFGFKAEILPVKLFNFDTNTGKDLAKLDIKIVNNPHLCRRILAIKLSGVKVEKSDRYISQYLELVGQRPLNNLIDITNFVMWETGHPTHAFDYDRLTEKKIIVREAINGEKLTTLDNKTHILRGGEIVFDDGKGEIVDLPGIMGTKNTVVTDQTKNVLLFIENSDPTKIRMASMGLTIRSQAAVLNEKSPDPENALLAFKRALYLYQRYAKSEIGSQLFDTFSNQKKSSSVTVKASQISTYLNETIPDDRVINILSKLGFSVKANHNPEVIYLAAPPSWRREDIKISEDLIEEIARIYGFHNIKPIIPGGNLLPTKISPILNWEEEMKIRLRDWGFTELYSYSMLSEKEIQLFGYQKDKLYQITNPLSNDLVYLRPSLITSVIHAIGDNLNRKNELNFFELSNIYQYQEGELPVEIPYLCIAQTGDSYLRVKGIIEAIFDIMGIVLPKTYNSDTNEFYHPDSSLSYGKYGYVGLVNQKYLNAYTINIPLTIGYLNFQEMVNQANPNKAYKPVSKYPSLVEDLTFIVSENTKIGPFIDKLSILSPLIKSLVLTNIYGLSRTFRITYEDQTKNLTSLDIKPIRELIISTAQKEFDVEFKTK